MNASVADSIALLRKMVATPSVTFQEGAVADLVEQTLLAWNLAPQRYGNNIVCVGKHYDAALPTLCLDAHIDTVPAASAYTRDPFDAGNDPDKVWGLGSNDDGGSVAALTAVFRHYYESDLPLNIVLVLNCEEERSGSNGAALLYGPEGPAVTRDTRWIIFGEPTSMRAATSERGLLVLDGVATGVSGHAAREEGVNAIYIALKDIESLLAYKFDKISPLMGKVKLSVTQINAGTAHNVVPDKCSFVVDIRPTEQYDNEEILKMLQKECKSELTARNLANRSNATSVDSALYKTVQDMGLECFSSPTTSNWMKISGKECIKMGPGDSSRSHRADEYILCSEIEQAYDKYIEFIDRLYGNTLE